MVNIFGQKNGEKKKRKRIFYFSRVTKLCILLAAVSCLVYANTLQNGYTLDDDIMIRQNSYVTQGIKGIPTILTTSHLRGYNIHLTDTYRQLSLVAFAIEYEFFGPNPLTGHLFNILFFAGCVVLLFVFLNKLFDDRRTNLAFITALLFAVHPIHVEAVASIKSRDELMCFFFAFLALNIFVNYARTGKTMQLIWGALCLFLAVISKETAATFIAVVPMIFFFYQNENRRRSINITIATTLVVAAFLVIRTVIINMYKADGLLKFELIDNALKGAPTTASHIATALLILGRYLKLLFIPYPLVCDYSYNSIPYATFKDVWVILSLLVYISLIICGFYRLVKFKKDPWAFGILFFLFTISLFTNIPFFFGATQADRLVFFASAGTCLLLALAIEQWVLRSQQLTALKTNRAAVLFIICILYGAMSFLRNMDWKDDYTLYTTDVKKVPNNTRLNDFAGIELVKKYDEEPDPDKKAEINKQCIKYFSKSLEIYPENSDAHAELGTAYLLAGELDSSILHFKYALALKPNTLGAITNLGVLYSTKGDYAAAIPYYKLTVMIDPSDTITWFNMGIAYMHTGKHDSAIYAFNKTISLNPGYNRYTSYADLAFEYKMTGNIDSARKYEAITKQFYPSFVLDSVRMQ